MVRRATKQTGAAAPSNEASPAALPDGGKPATPARMDTASLGLEDLANVILARQVRPRVADIRRLAEGVLKKKRKKAKKDAKAARKLSKIPVRRAKK